MVDPALPAALAEIALALAHRDSPEWVPLCAEAARRSMSTAALRDWCLRHAVEIREATHRDAWVQPAAIDRVVAGFPRATRAVTRRGKDETEEDAERALDELGNAR